MFKSKRISLLTIFALILPSAAVATFNASAAMASSTELAVFQVNGQDVTDGSTVNLDPNTTSVAVTATPVDETASVTWTGDSGLVAGSNDLIVTVITTDELSAIYTVNLNVLPSTDTTATISVNGVDVVDGEDVYVPYGTESVAVTVATADPNATYFITGDLGLQTGDNDLVVSVTAADGVSIQDYTINVNVHLNTDTSVNYITVNGQNVTDGSVIDVEPLTVELDVQVDTTDIEATFEIDGDHDLTTGENQLMITVTAADGETQQQYFIAVNVLPNTDVSLAALTVNGVDAADGDYVTVDAGTTEVEVYVETTDSNATYEITGGTDLVTGENDLLITVTAADGETVGEVFLVIVVAPSNDTSVESITVNGEAVEDGGTVYLEPFTEEVEVSVTTTDPEATYLIDGDIGLGVGDNMLTVIVMAADGETSQDYYITLVVSANHDASIDSIYVSYMDVDGMQSAFVSDGDSLDLPAKNYSVEVTVETTDPEATVEVAGNTDLAPGENTMIITVTAADGETTLDAYVTLVLAIGDVTTSSFTVDGNEVNDGDVVELEPGTESVDVYVETMDEDATYEVNGDVDLVLGDNELVVAVTSADGALTVEYKVTLKVLPYTDASFSSIEVNGIVWEEGVPIETEAGDLDVVVYTNNEYATVSVEGSVVNVSGIQVLNVTVTAQDGETTESAQIDVIASTEIEILPVSGDEIRVGSWMKISRTQFDKAATLQYFWFNGFDNQVGTGSKYQATLEDYGTDLRAVVVINQKGQSERVVISKHIDVLPGIMKKTPTPSIKGKSVVGNTLTGSTKAWMDGVELVYQWYRNGEPLDGANGETYDLTPEDVDSAISLGITGSLEGYETVEVMSKSLVVAPGVLKYTDRPSISGDFVTGGTIEVNPGTWLDGAEISIQWMRNDEEIMTTTADETSYVLTQEDYAKRVGVIINVSAAGYKDAVYKIKSRQIKVGTLTEVPTPVINGDPIVGETIDVDMGEYPDGANFTYVWKRDGRVIQSAYDAAYTLTPRDANTTITVKIIAKIWGYKIVRVESDGVSVTPAQ